jgi:hypothetical protein
VAGEVSPSRSRNGILANQAVFIKIGVEAPNAAEKHFVYCRVVAPWKTILELVVGDETRDKLPNQLGEPCPCV